MCCCERNRCHIDNNQSVPFSDEIIFIPVVNIQSTHEAISYPFVNPFTTPLTRNARSGRTTFHYPYVSGLRSTNYFWKMVREVFVPPKDVRSSYKISLRFGWDCVFRELRLDCKSKYKNRSARQSVLSRRKTASINSVFDNPEDVVNDTAKEHAKKRLIGMAKKQNSWMTKNGFRRKFQFGIFRL